MPPVPDPSLLRRLVRPIEAWMRRHARGAPRHPRTLRDHALARRLHRTLARDAAAARLPDVRLYVASGTVVVEATVAHGLDRDLLVRLVGSVRGVARVVSRITVTDGGDAALP